MEIKLKKITIEDKSLLANMFQLYLYDITRFLDMEMNSHGLYDYAYLDYYWTNPNYEAFFITVDQKIAGFALLNDEFMKLDCSDSHCISEFFILNKYRKNKIGKQVVKMIFDKYRGYWEVRPIPKSPEAKEFWEKVIKEYTNDNFEIFFPKPTREIITFKNQNKI